MNRLFTILMVICALSGCATQPAPASPPTLASAPTQTSVPTASPTPEPDTFESLESFQTALAQAIENNAIDRFWDQVVAHGPGPLVFDNTAVFVYRGEASTVHWSVDYAISDSSLEDMRGQRQGNSDIWLHVREFPADARLSYRLIVDDNEPIPDPLNPRQAMEGSGPVSELRMPEYVFPEFTVRRDDIPRGYLSESITFHSEHLPYAVTYLVYTPFGYGALNDLPVIYVADGQEYLDDDLGSMVIILDNLIAEGAIEPIIAVFLDPRDAITGTNRRASQYAGSPTFDAFLVEELVPTIDAAYRTRAAASARAILGSSLGGMLAAHLGLNHPDTFGLIGMHSPAFVEDDLIRGFAESDRLPLKIFMSVGTLGDVSLALRRYLRDLFLDKGYPLCYLEVNEGHSWGNYRQVMDDTLICFFGQAR